MIPHWASRRSLITDFSWRHSVPRILADIVLINAAVILAFLLWFAFYIVFIPSLDSARLARTFRAFYLDNFVFLTAILLLTFFSYGFYTKAARYENRYKMVMVMQAVTVGLVIYTFLEYFLFRAPLIPRGVAVLVWVLGLLSVGGTRLLKSWVVGHFDVVPVKATRAIKPENLLVIGGAGYIGSGLVRQLLAKNYRVRVLDSLLYGGEPIRELEGNPRFELVTGDFRNVEAVVRACRGMDAVIHLGAIVGDPACALQPTTTLEINFAATKMVMEICKGYGISRFLFTSSCSVYGASDSIVSEDSEPNPISLYAATKVDSERAILEAQVDNFHPTILRLATAFGFSYRPRFDLVVNLLTMRALTEKKITIFNGTQWRPFIHVHDIASSLILCLEAPLRKVSGEIFNAGSNSMNFTLGQAAEMVREHIPDLNIEYVENADKRNYRTSFDKIRTSLGFECNKTLRDGILEIIQAYADGKIGDYRDKRYNNEQYLSYAPLQRENGEPNLPISRTLEYFRKLGAQSE